MQGESGSPCYPSQYFGKEGTYKGGKDGKMHEDDSDDEMMGKMMKEGMDDMKKGDMEGQMEGGMKGPKGMMDKFNGMEGMLDRMGKMSSKDQEQMQQKLENMKKGGMSDMMKGGMQGMKDGMQKVMSEKFNGMMNSEGKEDMMSKMGGKEGMMQMMGMTGGKDKDGRDMKEQFKGQMEKKQGMQGGPPSKEDFEGKMEMRKGGKGPDGEEKDTGYRGGCAQSLCCGNILEYGVWKEEYICYDMYANVIEEGNRFKCVEGAKSLIAGTVALLAASFMMQ